MEAPKQANYILYVGTYGQGVLGYRFNAGMGDLKPLGLLGQLTNPSFLAVDPGFKHLYAVSELDGQVNGDVGAFAIDRRTAALKALNTRSSQGQAPCHISVDHTDKIVSVANYGTGEIAVFPVNQDGSLGDLSQLLRAHGSSVNRERQEGPHAHEAVPAPDNRFLYVPDLGLDQIRIYKFDAAAGKLADNQPPFAKLNPGNGPRHIALSSDGKFAYVANELKPLVTVFTRDPASGTLAQIQELPMVPEGFIGECAPAEVELDRAGRFLYASNRGPGTIAVFAVAPGHGTMTRIQVAETGGTWPRGFVIDPSGQFLVVGDQKASKFVLFSISSETGKLTLTGKTFEAPSPVSFVFVPAAE